MANKAVRGDIVVALISGGGSALLPYPVEGVTLEDKRRVSFFLRYIHMQYTSFTHIHACTVQSFLTTYVHRDKHIKSRFHPYTSMHVSCVCR